MSNHGLLSSFNVQSTVLFVELFVVCQKSLAINPHFYIRNLRTTYMYMIFHRIDICHKKRYARLIIYSSLFM